MHRTHRFGFVYVSTHKRLPRAPEGERLGRAPRCARWGSDPFVAALAGRPRGRGCGSRAGRRGGHRLEHARARDSLKTKPIAIDLGNEPPISVDGDPRSDFDRRRVSVRWLSGTILTGLCGAALMGGAVFAALDGQAHFAANPERVESALRGSLGTRVIARKSDRLPP